MNMILLLHIIIALISILFAGYGFMAPSKTKLHITYGLIAATFVSGTYLVIVSPAHMVEACTSGLFYTLVMVVATIAVRRKISTLATEKTR